MAERACDKIAGDWASRGFSCELWTSPLGQRWKNFRPATDELATLLKGRMEVKVAGQVHHLQIGEELLIPKGSGC